MHRLQQQIIYRLSLESPLRYARLKPAEVEGNHFMYHLRKLLGEGLVAKREGVYELTPAGMLYVDKLSLKTLEPRIQPKIVTLIACQNEAGEWLLYRRRRQPFTGLIGFPYGKIHLGERIAEAAERELEEKTGLQAELTHVGDFYSTVFQGGELISQQLSHMFVGERPQGELREESNIGECFWATVEDPDDPKYFPGFSDLYRLITESKNGRFFAERTYEI
jgi:ADP-ribose pyrophosphatase YjhB (NUDIX family)